MWKDEYLSKLNEIIDLISKGDLINAKKESASYFTDLRSIGDYSQNVWRTEWRRRVYDFGKMFKDDASWILEVLKKEIEIRGNYEALDFINSEIIWNYFDNKNDFVKDEVKQLMKKYPANPEFHHTYSHVLEMNTNFDLAVSESKHSLSQEKNNYIYLYTYVDKVKKYFDHLINNGKLDEAQEFLDKEKIYYQDILPSQKDFIVRINNDTTFSMLSDRLKDHITLNKRVEYFSKEINRRFNIEQKRVIEVLGLFSAILGFVLTNITISISKLYLRDMIVIMIMMAITLLIFAITISYLFGRSDGKTSKRFWQFLSHQKFWALIVLITVMYFIFRSSWPNIDY
jgi:hypothetical protein